MRSDTPFRAKWPQPVSTPPTHTIFDHHVVCLAGDGCLQEGVSAEAAAFAAHNGLDNLILIYDSNDVTLDAMAVKTQSEDTAARFAAYGFETHVRRRARFGASLQDVSRLQRMPTTESRS